MEFLGVGALSSSQLLVVFAFALFATIIFSSIYIRIRGQYRGRNKLPDHTQRRGLGLRRTRDSDLPSIPKDNHEVVSGARRKAPAVDEDEGFQFDFDLPQKATGPIEHVAAHANGEDDSLDHEDVPVEDTDDAFAEPNGSSAEVSDYEESSEDAIAPLSEIEQFEEASTSNGAEVDPDFVYADEEMTDAWDVSYDDEYDVNQPEETPIDSGSFETNEYSGVEEEATQANESEFVDDEVLPSTSDTYIPTTESPVNGELVSASYDDHEDDQSIEPEVDENVVPFDHRTSEAKRVGTGANVDGLSISVVSVCLISDEEGQIFRDIRGEHLAAFLNKRGFIYLDEEYHLQYKSMVEKGAIRVRNYEDTSIGTLVKNNMKTRGFRLYFRPSDCVDPLATLNEMLKVANLAIGFFSELSSRPLVIYDGRKDISGNISRLTQGDYNQLKRDLSIAFPRTLDDTANRTAITRNEFAPSDDLPTRAEQY